MTATDPWIRRFFPSPDAPVQLVCLPHAGGSASFFRPVAQALNPRVEVLAVQYPGRQDRHHEPMIDSIGGLADHVCRAVTGAVDRPFALFGHSMGATLAFEVAVRLEQAGRVAERVFVSGRRAPSCHRDEQVHQRDDAGIIAELRRLSGTDQRVFGDDELMRMVLPAVRNDYRAAETYVCATDHRLRSPVTALTGDDDPKASHDEVRAWSDHTQGAFEMERYPGGHFFLVDHAPDVIRLIRERLTESAVAPR
ncbi:MULTISPECIES: thioesterase II family protein [Streptomyces]|uniref:Type II thioesterase n=2 Tax=Streptomyces chartreusis TaxID=1969 RepID=F8QZS4_STRCX|nr:MULTISPECIES: alpha/beta fold hydrolase [Streptomyces]AEH42494.1 type II thioesterase [Streptomyces chartreusis NRRL 3882]MYS92095.1 alpha/beta fold hydrolase [Streptomyces sp. SID5464]SOR83522.1 Phenyloxazoline synthase MbtB [Streptomyces chartreusis NRRL 3882]